MIRYDFDEIERCSQVMNRAIADTQAEVDALRNQLNGFLAGWEGDGNYAYADAKRAWDEADTALRQKSAEIAQKVQLVNNAMRDNEGGITKTFRDFTPLA